MRLAVALGLLGDCFSLLLLRGPSTGLGRTLAAAPLPLSALIPAFWDRRAPRALGAPLRVTFHRGFRNIFRTLLVRRFASARPPTLPARRLDSHRFTLWYPMPDGCRRRLKFVVDNVLTHSVLIS